MSSEHRQPEDRRKSDTAVWAIVITALIQFATIVWFAASMNSSVMQLNNTTGKLQDVVGDLNATVGGLDKRVTVIEDRLDRAPAR